MDVFGPEWENYTDKIAVSWKRRVTPDDLVLIPGDISWAMRMEEALLDLEWLHALPGTKIILRGNHDYWWPSNRKLQSFLPPSILFIHNNAINWHDVTIGGTRLWDTPEYNFGSFVAMKENPRARIKEEPYNPEQEEKIFIRELQRLRLSLEQLNPQASLRIALTHYAPIGANLAPSRASKILEEFGIQICVFGHLHRIKKDKPLFGEARGIRYIFTSCDYLDFSPIEIVR